MSNGSTAPITSSQARLPVVIEVTSTSTRTPCSAPTVTSPLTEANRALIVGARKPARPENATTARPGSIAQVPAGGASVGGEQCGGHLGSSVGGRTVPAASTTSVVGEG